MKVETRSRVRNRKAWAENKGTGGGEYKAKFSNNGPYTGGGV